MKTNKKPRIFYGWVMLGIAIAMALATMPSQTILVSLFNNSFREAMGLSVTQLSAAYTVGTILAAFPIAWVGRQADKHGLRIVVGIIIIVYAGSLILLGRVGNVVLLGGTFFLIRFLGQGSLGMLAGHTIAMWFERRLGRVNSVLAIAGFAAGSAIFPQPAAWLIIRVGAADTLLILAGIVLLLVLPAVIFIFRNKPEDIGQHLDGDEFNHITHDELHGGKPPVNDPAFTVKQTIRTSAYWIIVTIMCSHGLIGTGLIFHMQEMLRAAGLANVSERQTALAIQPWPITFGISMLLTGWLADKFQPQRLLPVGPLLMGVACVLCLAPSIGWVETDHIVIVMATAMGTFGFGMGFSVAVSNPTIARYFGRTNHGAIRGTTMSAGVAATGIGPLLMGGAYELANYSFTPILIVFACSALPLTICGFLLRRPLRKNLS